MYVTTTDAKLYGGVAVDTDDTLISALLARAQAAIDTYCQRRFEARTETRYYRQDAISTPAHNGYYAEIINPVGSVLYLDDDLLTVTTLTNGDGVEITSANYWLEPRNSPPYWYIRLKSTAGWSFDTDGEISVAGTWGYSTTPPADIVHATIRLCWYYYKQKDAQVFDTTATPELGIITTPAGIPKDVQVILTPYRRIV